MILNESCLKANRLILPAKEYMTITAEQIYKGVIRTYDYGARQIRGYPSLELATEVIIKRMPVSDFFIAEVKPSNETVSDELLAFSERLKKSGFKSGRKSRDRVKVYICDDRFLSFFATLMFIDFVCRESPACLQFRRNHLTNIKAEWELEISRRPNK